MEKERGFRIFANHQSVGSLGYGFLTEAIIYLLALHYGAGNLQLGFISGTIYLAGIGLFLMPRLVDGHRLKFVYLIFWFSRGIVCLAYLSLLFLKGQPAVWLILVTYTLFCMFRIFGMAAQQPLVKSLLDPAREGKQLSILNLRFNISNLISRGISFGILTLPVLAGLPGYLILVTAGVVLNSAAVGVATRIPNREIIDFGQNRSLIKQLAVALGNPATRPVLAVQWLFVAGSVFSGFVFPWLRNTAGLTPGMIFLYTLTAGAGAIIGNFFLGTFIDRTGARPLVIMTTLAGAALYLLWSIMPAGLNDLFYLLPGLISGFLMSTGYNVTNRQIYGILPESDKVGFSAMNSFVCAVTALLAGLGGGMLANLGKGISFPLLHSYSLPLAAVTISLVAAALISILSRDNKSLSVRHTARLMLNLRNREMDLKD